MGDLPYDAMHEEAEEGRYVDNEMIEEPVTISDHNEDGNHKSQKSQMSPTFHVSNRQKVSVGNIKDMFIAQLDLRLTDYFTNIRCACSYTLYSLHFNDFGVHKVVKRRFSEIWKYDEALRSAGYKVPVMLPPKQFWKNTAPDFLLQRFQGLKNYFAKQLKHPSMVQLYILHMFLGGDAEAIVYIYLVLASTKEEKMKAVNTLLGYLMKNHNERREVLAEIMKPPFTSFIKLSTSTTEEQFTDNENIDYRLSNQLVFDSLLELLVYGDQKAVYEVCAVFFYMLHHGEKIKKAALNVQAIRYVAKAISRLLISDGISELECPFSRFLHPLTSQVLDYVPTDQGKTWSVVSYYLVMALNLMPETSRSFLENAGFMDNLSSLIEYNDYDIMRRFSAWLLWNCAFQKDLNTLIDRHSLTLLLKKLYASEDATVKMLCGLVTVALMASGWFDRESEPRALASVMNLLDYMHDLDVFIHQQIFSHWSISRFCELLGNTSLPVGARLFLVSVLNNYVMAHLDTKRQEIDIEKLCESERTGNITKLAFALFGTVDGDYRKDVDVKNDLTFKENFVSMYYFNLKSVSEAFTDILYDISDSSSRDRATVENEDLLFEEMQLAYATATCLLALPYNSPTGKEGDYFDVNFNPNSCLVHFRNVAHMKGGNVKLTMDKTEQINLEDTAEIRLDSRFFNRRLGILRVILVRMKETAADLENIHLSNNEVPNDCTSLLRRFWSPRNLVNSGRPLNTVDSSVEAVRDEEGDIFNNFEFPGLDSPILDLSKSFRAVDALEVNKYLSAILNYGIVQRNLLKLTRFFILFYQTCDSRLKFYTSMLESLECRIDEMQLQNFDELVEVEERFTADTLCYREGMKKESEVLSKLQENNSMLTRVHSVLKSNNLKLDSCRKQVLAIQKRIDDIPRLREDSVAAKKKLENQYKELQESIDSANDKMLKLQGDVADDESLKQEYSLQIKQLTNLSSIMDLGSTEDIMKEIQNITPEEIRNELQDNACSILSENTFGDVLDSDTAFKLKRVALNHLNNIQEKLTELYNKDTNHQIVTLNRKVKQDEDRLYRVQVELQSARRSLVIDSSVLEESLAAHKAMLNNLQSTKNNLELEVSKINDSNKLLDEQLATLRGSNEVARLRLEETRECLMGMINQQRKTRLDMFWKLLDAEFMCKKMLQEQNKLLTAFDQKDKLLDVLNRVRMEEQTSRNKLIASFKVAAQRLEATAEFLDGSTPK